MRRRRSRSIHDMDNDIVYLVAPRDPNEPLSEDEQEFNESLRLSMENMQRIMSLRRKRP